MRDENKEMNLGSRRRRCVLSSLCTSGGLSCAGMLLAIEVWSNLVVELCRSLTIETNGESSLLPCQETNRQRIFDNLIVALLHESRNCKLQSTELLSYWATSIVAHKLPSVLNPHWLIILDTHTPLLRHRLRRLCLWLSKHPNSQRHNGRFFFLCLYEKVLQEPRTSQELDGQFPIKGGQHCQDVPPKTRVGTTNTRQPKTMTTLHRYTVLMPSLLTTPTIELLSYWAIELLSLRKVNS